MKTKKGITIKFLQHCHWVLYVLLAIVCCNCNTDSANGQNAVKVPTGVFAQSNQSLTTTFHEDFESGSKGSYATATVTLTTGSWALNDALIGSLEGDRKNGTHALRLRNTGTATMNFDIEADQPAVTIAHAIFGNDAGSTWQLYYSTNKGATWLQAGNNVHTGTTAFTNATFSIPAARFRLQIRKTTGGRLNIDDIVLSGRLVVTEASTATTNNIPATDDETGAETGNPHLALGNPSAANSKSPDNYLLIKHQFALSYNNKKGIPNWVSWHLSAEWKGSADRCNCFEPDGTLPADYFHATTHQYTGTGFDRGHLCPSDDRDLNTTDNAATFLMTNITPQAPHLNQQTWEALEAYCRKLVREGNELYIIAGQYGVGGTGSKGCMITTIADGNITVPAHFWKVMVILPEGGNDVQRINAATRIIAVDMPNTQTANAHTWDYYRTSVDAIEAATGYDLLSKVPVAIQKSLESAIDIVAVH